VADPASLGLSLTCKKNDKIIFHTKGSIIGWVNVVSGKSELAFSFPDNIDIDRESIFVKKYPSTTGEEKGNIST